MLVKINEKKQNREQLLKDAKQYLGDVNYAVEVGTWRGDFSLKMIRLLSPKKFSAVDPYRIFPGMVSAPGSEYNAQADLDKLAQSVKNLLENNGASLIREKSVDAAAHFQDNSLDLVYIDGDHTLAGVQQDLAAWWPKVKVGGIFCGDDYNPGKTGKGFDYGVVAGVNQFAEKNNLDLTVYTLGQRQWLIYK